MSEVMILLVMDITNPLYTLHDYIVAMVVALVFSMSFTFPLHKMVCCHFLYLGVDFLVFALSC